MDTVTETEQAQGVSVGNADRKRPLENARYAALTSRACTHQAHSLTDHVVGMLPEATQVARDAYAKARPQWLRRAVEGFLGDLLQAQNHKEAEGYVYRPLSPGSFTGGDVSYRAFTQVKDGFLKLGLIEPMRGFQKWVDGFDRGAKLRSNHRKATRFRATSGLLEASAAHGVPPGEAGHHFILDLPKKPLLLRARSTKRGELGSKQQGKQMRFAANQQTEELEAQVRDLNAFFDRFTLRGGSHRGFIRVFNLGDCPGFNWNKGGRLYSQGVGNFQQMPREERLRMTIDGEKVCEIDISSSYLTILHTWHGRPLSFSPHPYTVPLGEEGKDVVKAWCVATFGSDRPLTRWPSEIVSDYREQTQGRTLGKDYPIQKVREAVIRAFPLLEGWGKDGRGWGDLMFVESVAIIDTMATLMLDHSIPALSMHDGLVVQASKRAVAEEVLSARYRLVVGTKPNLVVHGPVN